ncbi:hypothetical protein PIIN_05610 [Serendipita indica DSM 11827]|uniref:Uncharacterized protein n=1 Tax=Serendipita indica (strain DSM 11827) TaxID=1109443 RepID=G4TK32_SERID|nr:hypothetical protein PIIN_05610 [Serendipita indica DSM 11827]
MSAGEFVEEAKGLLGIRVGSSSTKYVRAGCQFFHASHSGGQSKSLIHTCSCVSPSAHFCALNSWAYGTDSRSNVICIMFIQQNQSLRTDERAQLVRPRSASMWRLSSRLGPGGTDS